MAYDRSLLPITFSNEYNEPFIDQFSPPMDLAAQARQRAIGASQRGSASGEVANYRPPFVPSRPPVELGINPIVPSAAAQYMDAMGRQRRALAESTRMQQGQIPQALSRTAQQGQAQIGRPMGVTAPQAQVAEDGSVKQDGGFLSKLYADPSSARGKALQAAAATALQLSGYQDRPVTTGQVLGAMMQSGSEAYSAAQKAKSDELYRQMALAAQTGKKSAFAEKLELLGIDVTTKEGMAMAREIAKSGTNINLGDSKIQEIFLNDAIARGKELRESAKVDPKIDARLNQAIDLLESGVETGKLEAMTLPLKNLAVGMGLVGDEAAKSLTQQQLLQSIADQLAPLMRVVGSGSSSDKDVELFRSATIAMDKTPMANLVIAKTIRQTNRHNKERLKLFDKYVKENKSAIGFEEYADEVLPPIYYRASSDDQLQALFDEGKIKDGDVYYNSTEHEFQFVGVEDE